MKNKTEQLNVIRDIPVAGLHGLQRQAVPEKQKLVGSLLRCASCPCFGASNPRKDSPCLCLPKTHSAVFHQDHYRHPLASKPSIKLSNNCRSYYRNEARWAPAKQDSMTNKVMQHISNVCGPCCPCPGKSGPCGPCGPCCGPCNCALPAPCNTPPRCVQYMTGYYYYPYGFWFCGPYHVTGTCVPGGPVAPGGPCGPCAPNPGGPCGPCNPACVCGVLNSLAVMPTSDVSSAINLMPSEQAMNMLDVTKIKLPFDMSSVPMSCLPLYAPAKGGGGNTLPPMAGPCSVCGPCCGPSVGGCGAPCAPCCGGCGPCGPCGPKGPFGPCGPCFPGVGCGCGGFGSCGSSAQCCVGPGCGCAGGCGGMCVGPCGPCGCYCGNCGPCGCGPCGCGPCGCGPCGCGPCGFGCGPCCGPCGPLTGPCGCGACGRGPCGCGACLPFGCGACCGVTCPNSAMPCLAPIPPPPTVSGLPPPPNANGQWTGPCINCKCSQPIPVNPASLGTAAGPGPFTQCCLTMTDEVMSDDPEVSSSWTNVNEERSEVANTPAPPKKAINNVQLLKRPGSNLTVFRRPGHNDTKQVNDPNKPLLNSIFTCYQSTMSSNSDVRTSIKPAPSLPQTPDHSMQPEMQKILNKTKFPAVENPRYCTPIVERELPSIPNCFTYLHTHPRCTVKPRDQDLKSEWPVSCK